MNNQIIEKIKNFLAADPRIKFAYLFGSTARGSAGPLSDLDIAVFLDCRFDLFSCRLKIMESLARAIKTERFDLVVLNDATPLLCHEAIKDGIILKEDRPRRVMFESRAVREYLDTAYLREIRRLYLKDKALRGGFLGQHACLKGITPSAL